MAYTVALTIMVNVPPPPVSASVVEAAAWHKNGDITGAYPLRVFANEGAYSNFIPAEGGEIPVTFNGSDYIPLEPTSNPRMNIIFVKDIPDNFSFNRIKNLINFHEDYSDTKLFDLSEEVFSDISNDLDYTEVLEQSRADGKVNFTAKRLELKLNRRFRINPSDVPQGIKDVLLAQKHYTVTFTQAKNFIHNKIESRFLNEVDL